MTTITVNGQTIHYTDSAGSGPALVFSHGALLDSTMWESQIAALSPTFRCIAWDARLHGRTQETDSAHTDWDSARDLLGLLDALGIESATLIGHSQGGFVSLRAALLSPGRVDALVLLDTMAAAWPAEAIEQMSGARDGLAVAGPDAVAPALLPTLIGREDLHETWLDKWRAQPQRRLADAMSALMSADDVQGRLSEITVPVLGIHGEDDHIVPLEAGRALHEALPGAKEFVVVPGAAHTPVLSHPDVVTPAIVGFLG